MTTPPAAEASRRSATLMLGSFAGMMAYLVASRATRDAFYLTHFPARTLPLMVAFASALAIAGAIGAARLLSRMGPMRVIPGAFTLSGLLMLAEGLLATRQPALAAVIVYLHVTAIGPVLVSTFWSVLNEEFDPRTAKREIGRITAIGTLGGLGGGLLAERSASWLGVPGTLVVLALMQAWCAWSLRGIWRSEAQRETDPKDAGAESVGWISSAEAFQRLRRTPYLRNLALLLIGSSVSAALLDYVFKVQVVAAARPGLGLIRLFAVFYTVVALITFAIQALLTRPALERAGIAPTIGSLPGVVVAGGVTSALIPGPWSIGIVRGLEAVLRGSLFRSGYELLYTPIPEAEKRATKPIVDIGCDKLGDIVGAGLVALVLAIPVAANPALLGLAILSSLATLALVLRLQPGYVSSLEAGLRAGGVELDSIEMTDWTMGVTMAIRSTPFRPDAGAGARPADPAQAPPSSSGDTTDVAVSRALEELRSGNAARVRVALAQSDLHDPELVRQAIALLAWDEVALEVIHALRAVASRNDGRLMKALLDPDTDFTVRRRLPSVLSAARTPLAVLGLLHGLADARFEVRYRCGHALSGMVAADAGISVHAEAIFEAVRRETRLSQAVWNSQKLLEQLVDTGGESLADEVVRRRAGRSMEHVFTLLGLVLPREPLRIAFAGLYAADPGLRGLALEYLESVLPPSLREGLWPHFEESSDAAQAPRRPPRARAEILEDLQRSNLSIRIDLEKLRQGLKDGEGLPNP